MGDSGIDRNPRKNKRLRMSGDNPTGSEPISNSDPTSEMGNNPTHPLDTLLDPQPCDLGEEERKCRNMVKMAIQFSIVLATDLDISNLYSCTSSWGRNDFDDVLKRGGVLCFLSESDVNQIIRDEVNKKITKLGISDLCDRNGYSFVNDYYV